MKRPLFHPYETDPAPRSFSSLAQRLVLHVRPLHAQLVPLGSRRVVFLLELSLYRLQRLPEALSWLDRTLELDPANDIALSMRPSVAAELASPGANDPQTLVRN